MLTSACQTLSASDAFWGAFSLLLPVLLNITTLFQGAGQCRDIDKKKMRKAADLEFGFGCLCSYNSPVLQISSPDLFFLVPNPPAPSLILSPFMVDPCISVYQHPYHQRLENEIRGSSSHSWYTFFLSHCS